MGAARLIHKSMLLCLLFTNLAHAFKPVKSNANYIPLDRNNDDECPPCFNCMLPLFTCKQFSTCNEYNGQCECMDGFGGQDCSVPACGGLDLDNAKRPLRNSTSNNDTYTEQCVCEEGWDGINCNLCTEDQVCQSFFDDPELAKGAVCNTNGMMVNKIYQACDVTNEKIIELLPNQKPQVSFHCDNSDKECYFQFWTNQVESFYCGFDTCEFTYDLKKNSTHYKCETAQCKCIPGEFLCGKSGFIDISDFLEETIQGPGEFTCNVETKECRFTEPAINDLITTLFGDPYIALKCNGAECLHYSQIPGYSQPVKKQLSWKQIGGLSFFAIFVIILIGLAVDFISKSPMFSNDYKKLDDGTEDDEFENFLNSERHGVTLTFEDVVYKINSRNTPILKSITGIIKPGLTAIMGPSGSGKSTLIDILSNKQKSGSITGSIKINGQDYKDGDSRLMKSIGFVDQDDYFLPTLTVYETILNSALLRLPKNMAYETKVKFVIKVLKDLRIYDIKDHLIGDEFTRGISGGERKRVAIGCELVKSPSILFLDEPTSGLDSANSKNVIDCLSELVTRNNTTVVCSIHQPRANVFEKFDSLIFLGDGEMYFSGPVSELNDFLINSGYECPKYTNIADFLLDITFDGSEEYRPLSQGFLQGHSAGNGEYGEISHLLCSPDDDEHNYSSVSSKVNKKSNEGHALANHELATKFISSQVYSELLYQIKSSSVGSESFKTNIYESQASWVQQVLILSSRTFKNVYRNPKLLLGNYLLSVGISVFLGSLYHNVQNDLTGFQNRMGLFFFLILFSGFLAFTGLSSFYLERLIFLKERSNSYYHPSAYYVSKIVSDIIPLRLIPPFILALIIYPLVGLNMGSHGGDFSYFFKFLGIMILFNFAISFEILTVGIFFQDLNAAIMFTVLLLLWSVLFSGLFINTSHITNELFKYMKNGSLFFYSYEALIINEVKDLTLKDEKLGLTIEVPGATILSTVGFNALNLNKDMGILVGYILFFMTLGYVLLHYRVIEKK